MLSALEPSLSVK